MRRLVVTDSRLRIDEVPWGADVIEHEQAMSEVADIGHVQGDPTGQLALYGKV
jgi:hypothetical protein